MHENKNNKWNEWNYSCDGFYFVTICTNGKYPYDVGARLFVL